MKHIITITLTLFLTAFAMAQERNYISTCDRTKTAIKWTEEHKDGKNAVRIEVSLTGFMSAFWSCDYYFDTNTLMFVGYKGVNGGPGTPETKISVAK